MNRNGIVRRSTGAAIAAITLLVLSACQPEGQQDGPAKTGAAAFYDGRNIRWIIPYSPGGGYDEYARLLGPFLEKYTGARVDIINLPGAGGMRGANQLYNAPKNGLTIGLINGSALVVNEIAGMRGAEYKIAEFDYLGRIVADKRVFVVTLNSGYDTIQEVFAANDGFKVGATGLGGSTYLDAVVINEAFNLSLDIVHGFDSSSNVKQSMLRGNISGTWGSWGSAVDAVDVGQHKVLLQSGRSRLPELADVPTTFELADTAETPARTRKILSAWELLHEVGRPLAAPPGTPPERLEFLREAFAKAMQDPELLAIASRTHRPLDYATADEMKRVIVDAVDMPDDIEPIFVHAVKGEL
ncbi:MAG: Bug family tripartite tricarboxylate transporter substrate binding protein [Woeseiaceae bacterium]